ncbi:Auxin-responsive protein SAUR72 [Linum perenne]
MPRTGDGSLMLMQIMKILSKRFTLQRSDDPVPSSADDAYEEYDDLDRLSDNIPADVKEGHFVVYAVNDAEPKRFVIRLDYLAHPGFVKLLELAAEEFGLRQAGVLAVPCRSVDLRRILGRAARCKH